MLFSDVDVLIFARRTLVSCCRSNVHFLLDRQSVVFQMIEEFFGCSNWFDFQVVDELIVEFPCFHSFVAVVDWVNCCHCHGRICAKHRKEMILLLDHIETHRSSEIGDFIGELRAVCERTVVLRTSSVDKLSVHTVFDSLSFPSSADDCEGSMSIGDSFFAEANAVESF